MSHWRFCRVPSRALPVDLGSGSAAVVLMSKPSGGKLQFHGVIGKEVLLPKTGRVDPPTICAFEFLDSTVRVVNEGGKPVIQVDKSSDSFIDEMRSM